MTAAKIGASAAAEWRASWTVVLAACAGMGAATIVTYSSGLFIEPLQKEFGWTRAQVVSGQSIAAITGAIGAPFSGLLVDRVGPRRLGIVAAIALFFAVAVLSLAVADIWIWRALWIPFALAIILAQPSIWTAAVASLFAAGRGLALAVILCGASISSIITPLITYFLIENYGWRWAYVGLAVFWALVSLPLICLFFTSAKDRARQSGTDVMKIVAESRPSPWQSGILTLRYAKLLVAAVSITAVVVTIGVSLVPILSSNGLTRGQAAGIASLLGASAIAGRLTIGILLDRLNGRFLAAFCVLMPTLGILILINFPGSIPGASAAVLIFGISLGAELDIVAYLTSRYFRLASFGLLFGTICGFITLVANTGPVLLNAVFDATGSYVPALWAAMPICLVSALLFLLLGNYPDHPDTEAYRS